VEKILDRFSLGHLLSVIAPGLVALAAVFLRLGWDATNLLGSHLASSPPVAASFLVILAYGLGLVFLECAHAGAKLYLGLRLRRMAGVGFYRGAVIRMYLDRYLLEPIKLICASLAFGIPLPRMIRSFVEIQMMMNEFNESVSGVYGLGRISSPFATLELFRLLVSRRKLEDTDKILEHASEVHNRLLFALSISLVLTLIGFVASFDFTLDFLRTRHVSGSVALALVAGLGSYCLRLIASRCWEVELILASSLLVTPVSSI
jgi:hypothetical protein